MLFVLNLFVFSLNPILPPINNIYQTQFSIPFIGKQEIEYKRIEPFVSKINLTGKINKIGYITFNENNIYDYTFDDTLNTIIKKYKCSFYIPHYDEQEDKITIKIKILLINYSKKLILHNQNTI
tara:strand:- start:180 stop:551 length:372 start_codon:yes stop_codon:yes gene_type:complete